AGFCPGRQNVPAGQSLSCSHRWVQTQFWRIRQKQLSGATQSGVTAYTEQASPNPLRLSPHAPMTASVSAAPRDSRGIRTLRFMLEAMLAQERGPGREAGAHLIDRDARGCLHAAPFVLPLRRNTVKVTALAALLLAATALAQTPPSGAPTQTPPSGAPTNEPKLRTDADIQREIDARV